MKYIVNENTDPYYNMAFDEFCLERLGTDEPVFCLWQNEPSVIIGINQDASKEVNLRYLSENGIRLVRRSTGGGAVYHDLQNLNYSIVGSGLSPQIMADALRKLGVDAQLTGRNDIFVEGRKVSGYARRIFGRRELVHGTLMYNVDVDALTRALDTPESKLHGKGVASVRSRVANLKEYLPQFASLAEFRHALHCILAGGDTEVVLSQEQKDEIVRIRDGKYLTDDWISGRI